ncbi:hypothetical protein K492DRAFT_178249 [Lichtheimia hyalospora FSU 10163]|nr:hypothetical protein K492DRAFT_178249 [Lichtheimia hyalospora FSU 10163]
MAGIVQATIDGHDCQQHFNALGGSYQQLVSCIATGAVIGAIAFFSSFTHTDALDVFSTSQYLHVCSDQDLDYLCLRYLGHMTCLRRQPERSLDGSNY